MVMNIPGVVFTKYYFSFKKRQLFRVRNIKEEVPGFGYYGMDSADMAGGGVFNVQLDWAGNVIKQLFRQPFIGFPVLIAKFLCVIPERPAWS